MTAQIAARRCSEHTLAQAGGCWLRAPRMPQTSRPSSIPNPAESLPSFLRLGLARRWLWLALAAVVAVYLIYSSFGIAGPFLWGHYGHHAASYSMRARVTMRYGYIVPATAGGFDGAPGREAFYLHHPIGYHHLIVPFFKVFGESEWVVRLVPVLGGLVMLWALYRLVRRFWSDTAGVLALAVHIALPFLCSFSVLIDPMFLEMACCLLAVEGFLAYQAEPAQRRRDLLRACIALFVGGLLMWEVYFMAFFMGIGSLGWWLRDRIGGLGAQDRPTPDQDERGLSAPLRWLGATFVATVIPFVFHFVFTWRVGMLNETLSSYGQRSQADWGWVGSQLNKWLTILYGKPLIAVGGLWIALFFVRLLLGRARRRDQAVWSFFLLNSLYYVLFSKGAAIHLYRVFFYSTFLTLATVDLLCDLYATVATWAARRTQDDRRGLSLGLVAAGVGLLLYFVVQGPHAVHNLRESRELMGTHGHVGYDADYPKQRFAMELVKAMDRDDYLLSYNLNKRIEFSFYADRRETALPTLASLEYHRRLHPRSWFIADVRVPPHEARLLNELLRQHSATLYYPFVMIDLRRSSGSVTAPGVEPFVPTFRELRLTPQPMSPVWRWFYSHKYPPLSPVPHSSPFGQCVIASLDSVAAHRVSTEALREPQPTARAATADLVCYHNALVALGRTDEAARFREALQALLSSRTGAGAPMDWPGMGQILGLRTQIHKGRPSWAEIWLLTDGSAAAKTLRFVVEPLGEAQPGSAAQHGVLFSTSGVQPWLWSPRPGYLIVDTVPLRAGRQRIVLHSQGSPMEGRVDAPSPTQIALGELEVP